MITRNSRHVKGTPKTNEQYLNDHLANNAKPEILEDRVRNCEDNSYNNAYNSYNIHKELVPSMHTNTEF